MISSSSSSFFFNKWQEVTFFLQQLTSLPLLWIPNTSRPSVNWVEWLCVYMHECLLSLKQETNFILCLTLAKAPKTSNHTIDIKKHSFRARYIYKGRDSKPKLEATHGENTASYSCGWRDQSIMALKQHWSHLKKRLGPKGLPQGYWALIKCLCGNGSPRIRGWRRHYRCSLGE